MTNLYVNLTDPATRFATARSSPLNSMAAAISAGFDLLPNPDDLASNRVAYAVATGSAGAYAATVSPFPSVLAEGHRVRIKVNHTNPGGGETYTHNGGAAKAIRDNNGAVLLNGMMAAGTIVTLTYVGGLWQLDQIAATSIPVDGSVSTAKLANKAVTFAKMQDISAPTVIGIPLNGGTGSPVELTPAQLRAVAQISAQQSAVNDATAGRSMIVGAFGLGGDVLTVTDFDAISVSGKYTNGSNAGVTGIPFAATELMLLHMQDTTSYASQVVFRTGAQGVHYRRKSAGVWAGWDQIVTAQTSVGAVAQVGGVPTGSLLEFGANADGKWWRFANNYQVCTKELTGQGPISTADGSLFRSANIVPGDYAQPFSQRPMIHPNSFNATGAHSWTVALSDPDLSAFGSLALYRATTNASTVYGVQLTAIGRWY